jgi:hypothetical protein
MVALPFLQGICLYVLPFEDGAMNHWHWNSFCSVQAWLRLQMLPGVSSYTILANRVTSGNPDLIPKEEPQWLWSCYGVSCSAANTVCSDYCD